ncbi:MAG: 50S ribosomal protein L19 [Candidatus Pacebacteria bacterium]|nr:50S ribosomal protein L19 [Candidatus Paceibacterota bacterium]
MAQYFKYPAGQTTQAQKFAVGDTIKIHQEVTEGEKTRLQVFEGIIIAIKNRGRNQSFTVRKIAANNVGVEKILPVFLPSIKKITLVRRGQVRRSKLYYLRDKIGKAATRVKEKSTLKQQKAVAA